MYRRSWRGVNQGTDRTARMLSEIMPAVAQKIRKIDSNRGDLILASWSHMVPPQFSKMTCAKSFRDGVLHVSVRHSSLLSLFMHHEKDRLLTKLKKRFPKVQIEDIRFRIG